MTRKAMAPKAFIAFIVFIGEKDTHTKREKYQNTNPSIYIYFSDECDECDERHVALGFADHRYRIDTDDSDERENATR